MFLEQLLQIPCYKWLFFSEASTKHVRKQGEL